MYDGYDSTSHIFYVKQIISDWKSYLIFLVYLDNYKGVMKETKCAYHL